MKSGRLCLLIAACFVLPVRAATDPASGDPADYIPTDVNDAVRVLEKSWSKEELAQIEDPHNIDNFFIGTGLRNSWGLWKGSRLAQWFNARGVQAPEDMSGIITDALVADLQKKPFDLKKALADAHNGEQDQITAANANVKHALASVEKIRAMMLNLKVTGGRVQTVTLPPRGNSEGVRVRYMAPFAAGFLITGKFDDDKEVYSPVYFLDLAHRRVTQVDVPGMKHTENGIVLGGRAYIEGPGEHGEVIVSSDGKSMTTISPPPGDGALRFGQDGEQLLALRSRAIYRLEGDHWNRIVQTNEDIPLSLVPPQKIGTRIYLRDEGNMEDDKHLWWIDSGRNAQLTRFDEDCGVVGPDGPRWENVWSFLTLPDGRLWLAPGYSLVRWDATAGYRVAIMHGDATFDGKLIRDLDPTGDGAGQGWTLMGPATEKLAPMAITGIGLAPDGKNVDVIGPNGLYRVTDDKITPLLLFKDTTQLVPMKELNPTTHQPEQLHWSLDPTHLLELADGSYLIGTHWEGIYLLAKDKAGAYRFTSLDEKIGTGLAIDHIDTAK